MILPRLAQPVLLCALLLVPASVLAAKKPAPQTETPAAAQQAPPAAGLPAAQPAPASGPIPTIIRSQRMNYAQQGNQAEFDGQVVVDRPDFKVYADHMIVYLRPAKTSGPKPTAPAAEGAQAPQPADPMGQGQQIEKIVATGKTVRILYGQYVGTGGKATYLADQEVLVLEQNPLVVNETDKSSLRGKVLRLYLRENRSEAEGNGSAPVEMFFTSKPSKEGPK